MSKDEFKSKHDLLYYKKMIKCIQKPSEYIWDALRDLVPFVQFKNMNNTCGGVLILIKLQAKACNFTKSKLLHGCFSRFSKFYKW